MTNPLKPILAGLGPKLAQFEQQAQERLQLRDQVRAALPAPEKDHVLSAAYDKDTLIITADSSVWSARLRYCEAELRTQFARMRGKEFAKLRVRVGHQNDADHSNS